MSTSEEPSALESPIGLIAGSGSFPLRFVEEARANGHSVVAVCHIGETDVGLENEVEKAVWIKVGQLGRLISAFKSAGVREVAMAGGISRVRLFGNAMPDARGAALLARLRSVKDDVVMRGVSEELGKEGIEVIPCTRFLESLLAPKGVLGKRGLSSGEWEDVEVGRSAIAALGSEHIGQLVVVREGVVVAVEAVEGSDAAIERGGRLGGPGTVVVKFAKPTQDMRFDVPTVGVRTVEVMSAVKARVLALEAGRCLMLDKEEMLALAEKRGISVVGCEDRG